MPEIISTHSHLLTNPQDLEMIAESGILKQVWLLGLPPAIQVRGYTSPARDEEMIAVAKRFPGFFLPFKWVDFRQGPDQIDRAVEQGFVGFKGIFPFKSYDDESYLPVYERIATYHCPMVFHTGYVSTPSYSRRCPDCGYQPANMRPASLFMLARMFPEITCIAAHFGFPWENELLDLEIPLLPNLYIDLSGGHRKEILHLVEEHGARPAVLPNGEKGIFADKFLIGIDAYLGHSQLHRDVLHSCQEHFIKYFEARKAENVAWAGSIGNIYSGNAERIMRENKLQM